MEPFLFENSFDSKALRKTEATVQREPTFDTAALEATREAALAEGRAAGETAALAGIEAATRQAITLADTHLVGLRDQLTFIADQARRDGLAVAVAAVRTLFPHLAANHGLSEIETVAAQCLELARQEPAIVFKFHPDTLEPAGALLEKLAGARAFGGKLVILADQKLSRDGCAVEWADGGAERDSAATLAQIERLVDQTFAQPAPTAPEIPNDDQIPKSTAARAHEQAPHQELEVRS